VAVTAAGRQQEEFDRHLGDTPTVWVGLYCHPDVLLVRERSRTDRWGGLAESSISVHDGWHYDLTLDTTNSPDPTKLAAKILEAVETTGP
jgi:chloramphenicol 3-O-phosphotransferase